MRLKNLVAMVAIGALCEFAAAAEKPAEKPIEIQSPRDYQVFQRKTATQGVVRLKGRAPTGIDRLEVQIRGDWLPVAVNKADGRFEAELAVPPGGWYACHVRATAGGRVSSSADVPHVGVGEVFVVAGQSNSANHGEEKQRTRTGMVAAFDGAGWRLANDPQPGASGGGGSFMPAFGDAIAEHFKVPVGIVACGVGATSVRQWLPKGATFPNPPTLLGGVAQLPDGRWESNGTIFSAFTGRMKLLGPHGFRVVLWHQGESDANQKDPTRTLPESLYRQYLQQIIRDSRREIGWDASWFVAQVSYHVPGDEASPEIRAAQAALWKEGMALEGPDSDSIKGDFRERNGKGVHFMRQRTRRTRTPMGTESWTLARTSTVRRNPCETSQVWP